MGSVAIHNWGVSSIDLSGMIHDDHLSNETGSFLGRVVLGITNDKASLYFLDADTLHVEADVVTWFSDF